MNSSSGLWPSPTSKWLYTRKEWSAEQADRYLRNINDALGQLRANPEAGRSAETIRTGYWSLHVGRHLVFYRFTDEAVSVRRVLPCGRRSVRTPGRRLRRHA